MVDISKYTMRLAQEVEDKKVLQGTSTAEVTIDSMAEKIIKVANRILEHRMAGALGVESREIGLVIRGGSRDFQNELLSYVTPMIKEYQQAKAMTASTSADVIKLLTRGKVTAKDAISLLKIISAKIDVESKELEAKLKQELLEELKKEGK